ncbi:hypothetical protein [Spirosoma knui]
MRLFHRLGLTLLAVGLLQACKPEQPDPAVTDQSSTSDSLITVTVPDFATVIKTSITPKGKLDRITNTYQYGNPGNPDGITTNLLYDAKQRIIGHTVLNSPSKGVDNAFIYEYANDKPYRTFNKVINPDKSVFYFMEQLVYDAKERPSAHLLYRVEVGGQARLLERNTLIYDSANRLVEIKDPNRYHLGQLFDYKGDNLQLLRHKNADGTLSNLQTEYRYDDKPNILKGVFWRFSLDYIHENLSNNNLISRTFKDNITLSTPTDYVLEYDTQNRLIRRSSTSASLGLETVSYFFND